MKNKMGDVRNHLVVMLEQLADPDVKPEVLERAKATALVAGTYISAVKVELDAIRLFDDTGKLASVIEAPAVEQRDGRVLSFEPRRA